MAIETYGKFCDVLINIAIAYMRVGSMAIVIFNYRADFLFFEKGIDIAKDRVEVARRINIDIDSTILCNIG